MDGNGESKKPAAALKDGAVDAVVAADKLQEAAVDLVKQAIAGRLNWKAKRQEKLDAIKLNPLEQMMAFNTAKVRYLQKQTLHNTLRQNCYLTHYKQVQALHVMMH
jgi:enoyl-CoA hydratase/carnithine racemase